MSTFPNTICKKETNIDQAQEHNMHNNSRPITINTAFAIIKCTSIIPIDKERVERRSCSFVSIIITM